MIAAPADPAAIHAAREALRGAHGRAISTTELRDLHGRLQDAGPFSPDAEPAGRRALRNAAHRAAGGQSRPR